MDTGAGTPTGTTTGTTPRLYRRTADALAALIASGALAPGERLVETRVAARFGISRAPARQALLSLLASGLVATDGRRGFLVVAPVASPAGGLAAESPPPPGRLTAEPTWQRIYRDAEDILTPRIAFAGWRVNEARLANAYGVSRTVARDVIARLNQRGLIEKDDSGRWVAPALSPARIRDLYELRSILEPAALVRAAGRLPPGLAPALLADLNAAAADGASADGPRLDALEEALHVDLLSHCGNAALLAALQMPQSLLIANRYLWRVQLFGAEPFLVEHAGIIGALAAGHTEDAAEALRDHLLVSSDRAIARLAALAGEPGPDSVDWLDRIAP